MRPAYETTLPQLPPDEKFGCQAVMSCMRLRHEKIGFLRTFGYPFLLNQRYASKEQKPEWSKILEIQKDISATDPVGRMREFGIQLCKKYPDPMTNENSRHTYANHCSQYERKEFAVYCLFNNNTLQPENRKGIIDFLADLLKWVFQNDSCSLSDFSEKLHQKFATCYPQYRLSPHGDIAKSTAINLYSLWMAVEYNNYSHEHSAPLDNYLPLHVELAYPRSNNLSENLDQISTYISIVESFPLYSVERFCAMERLWNEHQNYYAGWELYAIYREGVQLVSTSQNFRWRCPRNKKRARIFLRNSPVNSLLPALDFSVLPTIYPLETISLQNSTVSGRICRLQKKYLPKNSAG